MIDTIDKIIATIVEDVNALLKGNEQLDFNGKTYSASNPLTANDVEVSFEIDYEFVDDNGHPDYDFTVQIGNETHDESSGLTVQFEPNAHWLHNNWMFGHGLEDLSSSFGIPMDRSNQAICEFVQIHYKNSQM